ncbi:MAG TPA: alpha/beta hydrolase [Acetobacteraceae bacterium]
MTSSTNWGRMTNAQRNAAYNNSAAVANSQQSMAARLAVSTEFRARHKQHLDIPYGRRELNKCDIYPSANPGAPCLVFFHGGYWQGGSREAAAILTEGVLAHGWSAALPGYTLAPDNSLAGIIAELNAAMDWFAANRAAYGITGKIIISGWSAGGHLTAMMLNHAAVSAGLAMSGVFELGPIRDTYLNVKLQLTEEEIATLSPLRLPPVKKPLSIAYGSLELQALVDDSRALHAMRSAAHLPGALIPVAGTEHFTVLDTLQKPDGELTRELLTMVD